MKSKTCERLLLTMPEYIKEQVDKIAEDMLKHPKMKLIKTDDYLLLVDPDAEIKPGNYLEWNGYIQICYKVHEDDIEFKTERDSVYCGANSFWDIKLCNRVIAYLPLSPETEELDLPLLPEISNKITDIEESAKELVQKMGWDWYSTESSARDVARFVVENRQFTLEDMRKAIGMARLMKDDESEEFNAESISGCTEISTYGLKDKYTEDEIIKSLHPVEYPKEFIPRVIEQCGSILCDGGCKECNDPYHILKTAINSDGKEVLIGEYKY